MRYITLSSLPDFMIILYSPGRWSLHVILSQNLLGFLILQPLFWQSFLLNYKAEGELTKLNKGSTATLMWGEFSALLWALCCSSWSTCRPPPRPRTWWRASGREGSAGWPCLRTAAGGKGREEAASQITDRRKTRPSSLPPANGQPRGAASGRCAVGRVYDLPSRNRPPPGEAVLKHARNVRI